MSSPTVPSGTESIGASASQTKSPSRGAVVVPADRAADVVAAAERITAREQRLLDRVRSGEFDPTELAASRARH